MSDCDAHPGESTHPGSLHASESAHPGESPHPGEPPRAGEGPQIHPADSHVQREAEAVIRERLERQLRIKLAANVDIEGMRPDGFAEGEPPGEPPILVEIWAHQGFARSAQKAKVMSDMCKLLLCERHLGKACRKVLVVADGRALSFLDGSWQGRFAKEFGIELQLVGIPHELKNRLEEAQERQYR